MTAAVDKSASDKTKPTGEARAAKLIAWFNAGAGGKIIWGKPGDFDACVRIAGKHMTPEQAKGFCSNRHKDATGARPGKAPAERARKASLLRRYLEVRRTKAIAGQRTYEETRELVARAVRLAVDVVLGEASDRYVYVRDLSDDFAIFDVSGSGVQAGLYQVSYAIDGDEVTLGEPERVEAHTNYDPATKALTFGGGSPVSSSAMVALYPPADAAEELALAGGYDPSELHVTLAFLGSDAVLRLDRQAVEAVLAPLAAALPPLTGKVSGIGRFTPEIPPGTGESEWPLVALIDMPALPEFRQRLVHALGAAGIDVARDHGFCPHMTLAMVGQEDEWSAGQILSAGVDPVDLRCGEIVLAWGDEHIRFPLGARDEAAPDAPVMKAVAGPAIKSDDAKRYTMAPLYPASPESPTAAHLDAHGDFATADDLQKAVWDYVRKGDRTIRDQHRDGTAIGECVEIMSWPYEVTVPMTTAAGTTVQKSFAAGTVFLGVVWNELGWSDVVKGVKRGYSLGGMATRVAVEMSA